jgi:hypothetical protein
LSVEWDILEIPASRNEEYYPCCPEPFSGKILIIIIDHKKVKPQESGSSNNSCPDTQWIWIMDSAPNL